MSVTIAVTGATGFIGGAITKRLLEADHTVRALVRSSAKAKELESRGISVVIGNLEDQQALIRLISGTDALIHCAGVVRGLQASDFNRVNVDPVTRIVNLTKQSNMPKRLVILSSLAAREPNLSFYAASKRKGEEILKQQASHLSWIALRPPAVYGPGDKELLPLFRSMAKGIAPVPGQASARFSLVFVEDLAEAVVSWLQSPAIASGIYTVHDGKRRGYDWREVAAIVAAICGRRVKLIPIPRWTLDTIACCNRLAATYAGYAPMLTPEKLRELRHADWVCDDDALSQAIAWNPRIQLSEGLINTPGWRRNAKNGR